MPAQRSLLSSEMDRKVTFQRLTQVRDPDTGAVADAWENVATVFAKVEELLYLRAPDESVRSSVDSSRLISMIWVHYRSDIKVAMRALLDGRILQVDAVTEIARRRALKIATKEWSHE